LCCHAFDQLKERYGKDPLDVESLVPALPLPEPERAADCLSVITECFQAIAEALAEKEAAEKAEKEKEKATKTSMFSFGSKHKASAATSTTSSAGASGGAVPKPSMDGGSAKSERRFVYDESDEDDQDFRTPLTSSAKTPHPHSLSATADAAVEKSLPAQEGNRDVGHVKYEGREGEEEDFEKEDAMRLAEWDAHQDATAGVSGGSGSSSRRSMNSSRSVHLAEDFKYW